MPYSITQECNQCQACLPNCPTGAIQPLEDGSFWIDPLLCNNCEGYAPEPQCVLLCPVDAPPVPLHAKLGRCRQDVHEEVGSTGLFVVEASHTVASAMVVWDACNVLAQRDSLPWEFDEKRGLVYVRPVNRGRSHLMLSVLQDEAKFGSLDDGLEAIAHYDVRAALLHLIFAAHATDLESPWNETFVLDSWQLEAYLGLDKRKDLNKLSKLSLLRSWLTQVCSLRADISWAAQGTIPAFQIEGDRLWELVHLQYHFQTDQQGCKHLVGLTLEVRAGKWASYFLNRTGAQQGNTYYQYTSLPQSLLSYCMTIWQQHEGAVRLLLWLLFKTNIARDQPILVPTLMRIAYGNWRINQAQGHSDRRKRLLHTFESDLEALNHYGLHPSFDPATYPSDIQPLWARVADLPDDAEAALEFWTEDGSGTRRLTDVAPRGKWERLTQARILAFEVPDDWASGTQDKPKRGRRTKHRTSASSALPTNNALATEDIIRARKQLRLSQRSLAQKIGKSQSWIRDIENGRFHANPRDQKLLRSILGL